METKKEITRSIVLREFNLATRAELAATILRDLGIECVLEGGIVNTVMPYLQHSVRLVVRAQDEAVAREALADFE